MTDETKEMAAMANRRLRTVREMAKEATPAKVDALKQGIAEMAACFIEAREIGNEMIKSINQMSARFYEQKTAFDAVMGRELAWTFRTENVEPNEVEDEDKFTDLVSKFKKEADPRVRDRLATKANAALIKSMESWLSKRDKLKNVTQVTGASEAEVEAAGRRFIRIEEIIATLKMRGETLWRIHEQAMTELTQFVEKSRKNFKKAN